jgi:hypothetical protein
VRAAIRWASVTVGILVALALPAQALAGADNFANALVASGPTINDTGNNAAATVEAGETRPLGWPNGPNKTHWLVWQAGQTSSATITTCGSSFDTMLAVWTGRSLATLQHVASNDDNVGCVGTTLSSVTFNAVGGQRYRIQVDGFSGASGNYQVHVTQSGTPGAPPNNNLAAAFTLSGSNIATEGGNVGATKQTGENDHFNAGATTSVWYSWTAPSAGTVTIDTCGSSLDTVLAVYRGDAFPLTPIVSNDDTLPGVCPSTTHSLLSFSTASGVTHRIAVAGFSGSSGYFALNLALTPDTTEPGTNITGGPSGTIGTDSASFGFNTTEPGSGFECKLDGPGATTGAYAGCTTPKEYSSLADGSYTFSVRAVDGSGNTDSSPATSSFTVDATPPNTTIDSGPSGPSGSNFASFAFHSSKVSSTFECKLDGPGATTGSYGTCGSPQDYSSLAEGSYTFSVRATDDFARTDASPATSSFTVDTTEPNTSITDGTSGTVGSGNAGFEFTANEPVTGFLCKLDGPGATTGSYGPCSSPQDYSLLADGSYTFSVRAVDGAGNAESSPATSSFTVDTTQPQTTIDSGPSGPVGSGSASFVFHSSKPLSTFECKLDGPGATTGSYGSPQPYSSLADGSYTFSVRATDSLGHLDTSAATSTFTVDTAAPDTNLTSATSGTIASGSASFAFSSPDVGATFQCKLDGPGAVTGSYGPCPSPQGYSSLNDGSYTFSVRAVDASNNVDASPSTSSFTVDTTAPDTSLDSGPAGTIDSGNASFAFSSPDLGATFQCRLDGPGGAIGTYGACGSPKDYSSLANGSYVFSVRAVDAAGNADASAANRSFTVAKPAPPGGGTTPPGGGTPPPGGDTTPPSGSASLPKQKLGKVVKSGKLVANVTTSEAASVSAQAMLGAKTVAKGSANAAAAGKVKVTLKLSRKARKKLAKLRKVKLTLRMELIDSAGNRTLVTKQVTLKR